MPSHFKNNSAQLIERLLLNLLFANLHNNPRSMKTMEARQVMLGSLYEWLIRTPGAFLSKLEIPSHISAAETDKRVAFIDINKGTLLYQFVRPNGYIGDYYAGVPTVTASELGASPQVSDPNDATIIVERVHLELMVVNEELLSAGVTTAKAVLDTWSIRNQSVSTSGGGEQYYLPLVTAAKKNALVIVKPEAASAEHILALELIALKNGLGLLTLEEINQRHNIVSAHAPYTRAPVALQVDSTHSPLGWVELQSIIQGAIHRGASQEAIELLEKVLQMPLDEDILLNLHLMMGSLCGQVGRITDAQYHLNHFITTFENADSQALKQDYKDIYFYARHHFGLSLTQPEESIAFLSVLKNDVISELANEQGASSSTSSSPPSSQSQITPNNYLALLQLDLAMRHNQIAARYSDELTSADFDSDGRKTTQKTEAAMLAETYLNQALNSEYLSTPEKMVALTELGFSLRKQNRPEDALHALVAAQEELEKYRQVIDSPAQLKDLALHQLGLRLGIGLALCRCRNFSRIPEVLRSVSKFEYMDALRDSLAATDTMCNRLLFNRWMGRNDSDLFVVGWFNGTDASLQERGTRFIQFYRELFPLEIDKICEALHENNITNLELPYLGEAPPTGINDADFEKLMAAISENTSLKQLYLRKCSNSTDPVAHPYRRLPALARALTKAQEAGQELTYLSFSASRYSSEEASDMARFLRKNKSLVVLQPSFYDISRSDIFEQYAEAIENHPNLRTLLTGLLTVRGAGKIIGDACEKANIHHRFKYLHPFPKTPFGNRGIECANNNRLSDAKKGIDARSNPELQARFFELKDSINKYNFSATRVKKGLFTKQFNRPGRTLQDLVQKIEQSEYSFYHGIKMIMAQSKPLGNPHPIYSAATRCLNLVAESSNSLSLNI